MNLLRKDVIKVDAIDNGDMIRVDMFNQNVMIEVKRLSGKRVWSEWM